MLRPAGRMLARRLPSTPRLTAGGESEKLVERYILITPLMACLGATTPVRPTPSPLPQCLWSLRLEHTRAWLLPVLVSLTTSIPEQVAPQLRSAPLLRGRHRQVFHHRLQAHLVPVCRRQLPLVCLLHLVLHFLLVLQNLLVPQVARQFLLVPRPRPHHHQRNGQ